MSNVIKENLTQAILIVFSVVLGLYLSERIEERKNRQKSANLLAVITSEVSDNIKLMEDWASYHQEMCKNLDSLSKNEVFIAGFIKDKSILFKKVVTRRTFMARYPANDAWDIAKSHPLIVNVDYDKLLMLSKVYNQQNATFEPMSEIFELYSSKNVNIEKEAKSNLEFISDRMKELVARELLLMHYYKEAKEIFDLPDNNGINN